MFEEPLWLNTNIVIGGYPIFYRKWWENDIKYICDICSVDGTSVRKTELESISVLLLIKWNIIALYQLYQIDGIN